MSVHYERREPTWIERLVFGGVHLAMEESGHEPSGFVVTKHELALVARIWLHWHLEYAFSTFVEGGIVSEWKTRRYCEYRLDAIAKVLGAERMNAIDNEVTEAFRKTYDQTTWRLFTVGTKEECAAFHVRQDILFYHCEPNPIEVRISLPRAVHYRCATLAEAETLAQRLRFARIPSLDVEIVTR